MDYTEQLTTIAAALTLISTNNNVSNSLIEMNNNISLLIAEISKLTNSINVVKEDIDLLKNLASTSGIITKPYNADIQAALLRMTLADGNQIDRFKLAKEEYKIDPIV